ncbi:MAG: hypothetical protein IJZ77_02825 [Bacilli bacterium]|nr:hypothetical protein [Bacilli bacterium]
MANSTNVPEEVLNPEPQVEQNNETQEENFEFALKSYAEIKKELVKNHGKPIKRVIKNVNYEILDTYTRVSFTLRENVKGYRANEDGEFVLGGTNIIFSSIYAIAAMLKEDDELAWIGNEIITNPKLLNLLCSSATIEIIQQKVAEGEEYVNPFASNPEPITFDHDTYINHIVGITLSKVGEKVLEKYMDKIMSNF